jgi:glycosyltransferase involved in cell wall biosynthesis
MRKLKVLLYGDVDLNIMDGSAVWLTSLANVLSTDSNINVEILLKAPIMKKQLIQSVENLPGVKVIETFKVFPEKTFETRKRMNVEEAREIIEELDTAHNYDLIIVRGISIVDELAQSTLHKKIIPYVTDFNHNKETITEAEITQLKNFYDTFPYMFVQTDSMKEILVSMTGVEGDRFKLLSPMIPNYESRPSFKNENNSLIYAGKFAEEWYTEEILDAFSDIRKLDGTIDLNIAGDKFQGALRDRRDEVTSRLENDEGVNWKGAISRSEVQDLLAQSDIGIAWRSSVIDNDQSVELSTKLLEYGRLGKPIFLKRTKLHEEVLGSDYPLFVESSEDFIDATLKLLYNRKLFNKCAKMVYEACKKYTFSEVFNTLKPLVWSFYKGKTNIVFAGHDLKFLKHTIEHFQQLSSYEVEIDQWKGHNNHDLGRSQELRDWADVVFCEWGLGNAVWYSQNKKAGQKLIVRMHLQERETEYPSQFNLENIDRIIAISPYIFEEFSRACNMPRNKMTMIYNMINTEELYQPKEDLKKVNYNLGVCGVLPSRKRLDKAVDILEALWRKDKRYKLYVKSKLPSDLPWMKNRPEEMKYFDDLFDRIEQAPWGKNVIFEKHGSDMSEWFRKIGYVLSTSDFESFHLAPMEGMVTGSIPVVLHWPGAETIYPSEYIFEDEVAAVDYILKNKASQNQKARKAYPIENFDLKVINNNIESLVTNLL